MDRSNKPQRGNEGGSDQCNKPHEKSLRGGLQIERESNSVEVAVSGGGPEHRASCTVGGSAGTVGQGRRRRRCCLRHPRRRHGRSRVRGDLAALEAPPGKPTTGALPPESGGLNARPAPPVTSAVFGSGTTSRSNAETTIPRAEANWTCKPVVTPWGPLAGSRFRWFRRWHYLLK